MAFAALWLAAVVCAPAARAEGRIHVPPEIARLYQEKPVIELVTMGVGSLIWERHGHIALCIHYDDPHDDRCYNYGIGDFHHPLGMTWGFFRGNGAFWVGKSPVAEMLSIYQYADRTIWVQPLPLNPEQKKQIIDKLEYDILEEHRHYAYDHFWDNCTTRVRDVIDQATGGQLSSMHEPTDARTFRDLAREGFFGMPVPLLVTDIAMGRVTDRIPTYYERMFLPQYLREAVAKRWGIQPIAIYERHGEPPLSEEPPGAGSRTYFLLAIVLLTAPAWIARRIGRLVRTGLALSVIPYVLLGATLTFLAIISPLPYVRWNEAILVVLPLDVLVLVLPAARRVAYARARLAMLALVVVLWLVEMLAQPLLPLMLWPAIPLAVVRLWPSRPARLGQAGQPEAEVGDDRKRGASKPRSRKRS
ncbi:MAG TPA: DUF4105 domain-containing protein [Kofleriaceae bacterium]|nr:DUF4105 domain-containing protein [Kofleriaceae bacterium]